MNTDGNDMKLLQELIFEKSNLASQQEVWNQIGSVLHKKWEDMNKSITVLAIGGNHSGKSYSLFGSTIDNEERGLIPRFIEGLFRSSNDKGWNAKYVMMNCCIIHEEEIYDLLDPPKCYSYRGSLANSSTNDTIILPLSSPMFSSAESLEQIFRLSLQSLAVLLSNSIDFCHNHHTIIKFQIFGDKGTQTVTFVELGSAYCPSKVVTSVDRFNGKSYTYRSMRAFKNCLKQLPSLSSLASKKRMLSSSVLTYLLQTDVFLEPNVICLNCIRGYEVNTITITVVNIIIITTTGSYQDDKLSMTLASDIKAYVTDNQSSIQVMQPYDSLISNLDIDIKETITYLYNALLEDEVKAPGSSGIYGTSTNNNVAPKGTTSKLKVNMNTKGNTVTREMDKYPGGKHDDSPKGYYYRNKFSYLYNYQSLLKAIDNNDTSTIDNFQYTLNKTRVIFEEPPISKKPTTKRKGQKAGTDTIPAYKITQPNQDLEQLDSKLHRWLFSMGLLLPGYTLPKLETAKAVELSEVEALQAEIKKLQAKEDNDGVSIESAEHEPQLGWAYDPHFHTYGYLTMISPSEISSEFSRVVLIPKGQTFIRGSQIQLKKTSIPYNLIDDHKVNPYTQLSPDNNERERQEYMKEEAFFCTSMGYHVGDVAGSGTPPTSPQDPETKFERLLNRPDVRVVRIHGPDMEPLHCKIRDEYGNLYISPERLESGLIAKVAVNGRPIETEVTLKDGDIIKLGISRFIRVHIPWQRVANSPKDASKASPHLSPTQLSRSPSHNHAASPPSLSRSHSHNHAASPPSLSRSPSHNHAARSPGSNPDTGNSFNFFPESDPRFFLSVWELTVLTSFESWLSDIVFSFEKNRRSVTHLDVNRPLVESSRKPTRTPEMNMKSFEPTDEDVESILTCMSLIDRVFICELVGSCTVCNYWSHKLRRGVTFDVNLRLFNPSDANNRGRLITLPMGALDLSLPLNDDLVMSVAIFGSSPNENGRYWLSPGMLCERIGLMKEMWESWSGPWCLQDGMWLDKIYSRPLDAFQDNYDDDLIGVGFVYLDSLQYLLDIEDNIPIIDINGNPNGSIKLRIRSWIDKIETLPGYIAVDKETHLSNFLDKKLIICFYFDGLQNLPERLCSSTYVYFKFFYHRVGFKTVRHGGENINPILDNIVRVDQRITKDFIQFLRTTSLEMEVFGKKKPLLKIKEGDALIVGSPHDSELFITMEKLERQQKKDLGIIDTDTKADDKVGQESIDALTDKLNEALDQLDDANYQISSLKEQLEKPSDDKNEKSADNELLNKQKMENKKLLFKVKQLEDELTKVKNDAIAKEGTVVIKDKGSAACIIC